MRTAVKMWSLLRLLPLLIGNKIPENDKTWGIILDIKDIVEILASPHIHRGKAVLS